jgi:SAM-dependent methyltransferase
MHVSLDEAEALEQSAAFDRVAYFEAMGLGGGRVLDVGRGNGYTVAGWRLHGHLAFGVDRSLYRLSRWLHLYRGAQALVVADARALPFRAGTFGTVISSGMLEHIGVREEPSPYRVRALPDKRASRAASVAEILRVTTPGGSLTLDFPNGWFPIDFWHGDRVGAFRLHMVPDRLNPSIREVRRYVPAHRVEVLRLCQRLRFRQISGRWWGRLLNKPGRFFLRTLDLLPRTVAGPIMAVASPFLVLKVSKRPEAG